MRRIIYTIHEYDSLIDSSNINSQHWDTIATDIYKYYELYDGFVILHGTDTLSYTASALSFMLENLGKTVIITGSQIPIFEIINDGTDNLIGALVIAGNYTIPEVTVFFHHKLMRGNRTIKFSANNLDAFSSPNIPELAKIGTEITIHYDKIFINGSLKKFSIQTGLGVNENVGLLRIFPNISLQLIQSFLHSGVQGVVLETYGCGNFMTNRKDLMAEITNAVNRGIIIVNCSQCHTGNVSGDYATGQALLDSGVLCGFDMTSETALCKISYILTKDQWDLDTKKKIFCTNLRGEMSTKQKPIIKQHDVLELLIRKTIKPHDVIFQALINTAIKENNVDLLKKLKFYGISLNVPNDDGRTPLHIACSEGNISIVQYLLHSKCFIHVRDKDDRTPFIEAVLNDHHDTIILLRKCGAHFTDDTLKCIGENLCSAAYKGSINRLKSYLLAGIDFSQTDHSGRTALHAAVISNDFETVKYLLQNGAPRNIKDKFGNTALNDAQSLHYDKIAVLLKTYIEYNK